MKKQITIFTLFLILLSFSANSFGQETAKNPDELFKQGLYLKYKKKIINYSRKQFDDLFFEFFRVQNDKNKILTKEEFYNYTVQIAVHSERLGKLYSDKKGEAEIAKKEWMARSYEDYLNNIQGTTKPKKN